MALTIAMEAPPESGHDRRTQQVHESQPGSRPRKKPVLQASAVHREISALFEAFP